MATSLTTSPPSALPQRSFDMPIVNQNGIVTTFWQRLLYQFLKVTKVPVFLAMTHSQKLATTATGYVPGSILYESDRQVWYFANGSAWQYMAGVMQVAQASLPTDLGTNDTNLLLFVTDYNHLLEWTGTAWTWGPGENGSDYIKPFVSGPPLTGRAVIGWWPCDGSANIARVNFDGTLQFSNVPVVANSWYRQ
jgi:hypothetical protein